MKLGPKKSNLGIIRKLIKNSKLLEEDIKSKALIDLQDMKNDNEYATKVCLNMKTKDPYLLSLFKWDESKLGFDFWDDLEKKLYKNPSS